MSNTSSESETKQVVATNANAPITSEPQPRSMELARKSNDDTDSMDTYQDDASGYQRETNECTEFCIDLFMCFGACDICCPSTGEGCLSTTAGFFGNICVGCLKC